VEDERDAIRRGDSFIVGPDDSTRGLAEELCRRFELTEGLTRLELSFQDGHLEFVWRHERVMLKRIAARYEATPA
jgi:hypothetical protein